jgi:hypothetical protein
MPIVCSWSRGSNHVAVRRWTGKDSSRLPHLTIGGSVFAAIADILGVGLLVVIAVVWIGLIVVPIVRERLELARALRDTTWSSLTEGALTDPHRGEMWAFWAGGGTGRKGEHIAKPTNRVVIDEVAILFVLLQGRRRSTRRAWLRREDVPVLIVQPVWHGSRIIDPVSGMFMRVRVLKVDEVVRRLEDLGWCVRVDDAKGDRAAKAQRRAA